MMVNSMLANHEQPAVLSAVMKSQTTHRARLVMNDAMVRTSLEIFSFSLSYFLIESFSIIYYLSTLRNLFWDIFTLFYRFEVRLFSDIDCFIFSSVCLLILLLFWCTLCRHLCFNYFTLWSQDVMGGAGICRGKNNMLGNQFMGMPIAITVEGKSVCILFLLVHLLRILLHLNFFFSSFSSSILSFLIFLFLLFFFFSWRSLLFFLFSSLSLLFFLFSIHIYFVLCWHF